MVSTENAGCQQNTAQTKNKEKRFCDWRARTVSARGSEREPVISYCILCRGKIPEKRATRGAVTCCSEHGQEYRRQRRAERATRFCRLCGRKARKPKIAAPVLAEHMATVEGREPLEP
jgi:hypothetical protein